MTMQELRRSVQDFIVSSANVVENDEDFNKIMQTYQLDSIFQILVTDFSMYMSVITAIDGVLSESEIEFLNYILSTTFTEEDIVKYTKMFTSSNDYGSDYDFSPLSVKLFKIYDLKHPENEFQLSKMLLNLYRQIGEVLSAADGDVAKAEVEIVNSVCDDIEKIISD